MHRGAGGQKLKCRWCARMPWDAVGNLQMPPRAGGGGRRLTCQNLDFFRKSGLFTSGESPRQVCRGDSPVVRLLQKSLFREGSLCVGRGSHNCSFFPEFFWKVREPPLENMCRKEHNHPKNLFLEFTKSPQKWTFLSGKRRPLYFCNLLQVFRNGIFLEDFLLL